MKLAIVGSIIAFYALWAYGRYRRDRWTPVSDVTAHWRSEEQNSKVLVILWTGAFNTGNVHYKRLIELFLRVGDVCVVNYAEYRFDSTASDEELFRNVMERRPEEIICVGASLGGEQALRFATRLQKVRFYYPEVRLIAAGVPLGGRHLPYPRIVLWLVKHLRIGPVWNFLLSWLPRAAFHRLTPDKMNGVDEKHLDEHMKAMWSVKVSAAVEQVAAMVKQPPFEVITRIPTVYLDCEEEDVIRGPEAVKEWKELLGECLLDVITVPGGHVQFVERHWDWCAVFTRALKTLGYNVN